MHSRHGLTVVHFCAYSTVGSITDEQKQSWLWMSATPVPERLWLTHGALAYSLSYRKLLWWARFQNNHTDSRIRITLERWNQTQEMHSKWSVARIGRKIYCIFSLNLVTLFGHLSCSFNKTMTVHWDLTPEMHQWICERPVVSRPCS